MKLHNEIISLNAKPEWNQQTSDIITFGMFYMRVLRAQHSAQKNMMKHTTSLLN